MSVALLDVNVLVALFDEMHVHHEHAHRWFGLNRRRGWSTCPMTINGCVRVLSNPAYPTVTATPSEVAERLVELCDTSDHHFWPDNITLTDNSLFRCQLIGGHQNITDVYLLGLAVRHHGRLVTFDRSVPVKAVHGAEPGHVVVPALV